MAEMLLGAAVAKAVCAELEPRIDALEVQGIHPRLAIVRIGAREDDLLYERGAKKRMEGLGIACDVHELPEDASQDDLASLLVALDEDDDVSGILLFRPLPARFDEDGLRDLVSAAKDVDCMARASEALIMEGSPWGFAPCTAEAVIRLLDHYDVPIEGARMTILGRSMVIGRPLAMLALARNATPTICHTRTRDLVAECRRADILVAAVGRARMVGIDMVPVDGVVVDVGINVDDAGAVCGDVDTAAVDGLVRAITPVPRGVGSVTTSILAEHVVRAAEQLLD